MALTTFDRMIEALILNPAGSMLSCITGWQDIFALANRERRKVGLSPLFLSRVQGQSPFAVTVPDIVLVPVLFGDDEDFLPGRDRGEEALAERLSVWHREGATLASACAGSFLLAAAGLLDGKKATTHWSLAEPFRARFPEVDLDVGELLVEHPAGPGGRPGPILCGGGVTAYIDVALALVSRFGGGALASAVARVILWDPHRPRQAAWAEQPKMPIHGDEAIIRAEAWIEPRLSDAPTLEAWAAAAGLGLRTFERRFSAVHGLAPGRWLQRRRLLLARDLLATSRRSWEEICGSSGYGDPSSFRELFRREFGLSPREYRQRFGTVSEAGTRGPKSGKNI